MTRPYFTRDRISHFEMFDRHAGMSVVISFYVVAGCSMLLPVDFAIKKMKAHFRNGHALDFQDLISRFTLDSATEFLFGHCVHSLKDDLPYAYNDRPSPAVAAPYKGGTARFSAAFSDVQLALAFRLRTGWTWAFKEIWKGQTDDHMEVVDAYLQPILEEAVKKNRSVVDKTEKAPEDDDDETLLDHLVKQTQGGFHRQQFGLTLTSCWYQILRFSTTRRSTSWSLVETRLVSRILVGD